MLPGAKKVARVQDSNGKDIPLIDWLKLRQGGIGGSDASMILGLNRYAGPLVAYMNKVEELTEVKEMPEAAEWGHRHEETVAQKFRDDNPEFKKVQKSYFLWQSVDHPFMYANFDRLIYHPEKGWGILEIKTATEYKNAEWEGDQVPEEYLIQVQHYLAVSGLKYGYFAVLIGGNKYRQFYIERDEELIEMLINLESDFWNNHVLALNPPEPDGLKSSSEVLEGLYPMENAKDKDEVLELSDSASELLATIDYAKEQKEHFKSMEDEAKNKLKLQLGDHMKGQYQDRKISWSKYIKTSFDSKKLKAEHPELYWKYTSESPASRFSVK